LASGSMDKKSRVGPYPDEQIRGRCRMTRGQDPCPKVKMKMERHGRRVWLTKYGARMVEEASNIPISSDTSWYKGLITPGVQGKTDSKPAKAFEGCDA
jgi:hypothetical protein